ncbi:ABC transporter substrate-binding protein [Chitinasiproducens palmae]|uniref:Peptide/nickel transport system substrate-binding protein n=1 Tax=Chitinasiproducens palmae TaxID=1770053 RepID=A0A1H2PJP3_9BURK|nr:ABC transporter substrate-binding protein [Chitinasiproducens palmae]SDV46500.1 peptide/nickel transport system substrate-binding protein [Chitinasiproducens palmae]
MTSRRTFLVSAASLAGAGLLPGVTAPAFGADRSVLYANTLPEPAGLVTGATPANPTNVISGNLFDGLVTYDKNFKPVPQLAESWQESDGGKTITFRLRRDVKWHDGTPFTSADVRYSVLEVLKKVHPIARPTLAQVADVETPDPHTAIFRLSSPSRVIWAYLDTSGTFIFPKHLYEGTDPLTNPYNVKPVGNGPFVFKEWVRGSHVTLVRNPAYWDHGKPHVDELVFRIIPDAGARSAALETGALHYAPLTPVSLVEAKRLAQNPQIVLETRGWEANAPMFFLDFNLRKPVFQDIRVRQAVAHAINREVLARAVFQGFATAATGPVPSYQKQFYTAATQQYPFDPAKAEALLDAAGFPRQRDGVRLRFNHLNHTYGDEYKRAGELFQQQLKRVGIELTLVNYDLPTYLRKVYSEHDFDTMNVFYAAFADPQIGVHRRFWSKAIIKGAPWSNGSGYTSAEMDSIIEATHAEVDVAKRQALIHRMQALAQKDLPSISLLELKFFRLYSKRLEGVNVTPIGVYASLGDVSVRSR